jgi:plasmid stabilization system protein ParE
MSSYRYSSDANSDIEAIALYIFDFNPVAAHHFLGSLEETCELLAERPLIGRVR